MKNKLIEFHNSLDPKDYLTSYNLARKCDVVFGEVITKDQFRELNMKTGEYTVYKETENYLIYRKNKIDICEGDIVFCKTDFILELFTILRKKKNIENISILTHQMDDPPITKELYSLKPSCIKYWFSLNVEYDHPELIPVPLGLGNEYAETNLQIQEIKSGINKFGNLAKKNTILVNFNRNTNKIRETVSNYYQNLDWASNEEMKPQKDFIKDLIKSKYSACPIGWGLDTHRYWESLYCGVIPVVDNSYDYKKLQTPSQFLYSNINEVNKLALEEKYNELYKQLFSNLERLTVSWWFKNIIDLLEKKKNTQDNLNYGFFDKLFKRLLKIRLRLIKFISKLSQ